uniref:Uncharacterized protein n=1 Tax=Rhizophora mucronata TaxID=61149 RepID=A0A2P2NZN8_RHIMU
MIKKLNLHWLLLIFSDTFRVTCPKALLN